MSTQYLNKFNENISENQSLIIDEYSRLISENNKVKKEEYYKNGDLIQVDYFLTHGESVSDIRLQYPDAEIVLYKNEVINGIYKKFDVEYIDSDNNLTHKRIQVYPDGIYPIYDKAIDINTGETLYLAKNYYDETHELTYEFEYNLNGSFSKLTIYDPKNYIDTDFKIFGIDDIGIGNNPYNFSWEGNEYYQNAEPIMPGVIT